MSSQLDKTYAPADVEAQATRVWLEEKCFAADPAAAGDPYTIVIPPPNVTGALHLGHAINNTLQDILTRVHRMRGFNTLWVPGIDHAGIATQAVVEKQLKEKENKTRHDIGREELVNRIWAWKEQFGNRILEQLKRLGCSCDWDRTRFTLDDMCARAVRETFFKLFKDGLIYRGKRLVNWDIQLQTSISDDEIYHETVKTSLWHIRYPIVDEAGFKNGFTAENAENAKKILGNEFSAISASSAVQSLSPRPKFMTVATTRPETMLGDTAVAVHPEDPRWNWAIGKFVMLPLTNRRIPIIADDILVDPKFGSGVVKVTPAHDPNDYAVWQRHQGKPDQIDLINILHPDGSLNENAGAYARMKRDAARKKVVEDLTALGLLAMEEPYETQIGHSDRSKTPVEPYLSDQWYVKMAPLAEPALEVVRNGTIKFYPERHAQQYLAWLGEKRDWPISRQLWWGHRIPVWSRTQTLDWHKQISPRAAEALLKAAQRGKVGGFSSADCQHPSDPEKYIAALSISHDPDRDEITELVCIEPGHPKCEEKLVQSGFTHDPDVLDTWFSSALWPHSTLGWPDQTPELKKYYPTSVLLTGRDIITLWVARMVMTGIYNMGQPLLTPSPGTPAEGWGEGLPPQHRSDPHPNPLPDYRARGPEGSEADRRALGRQLGIPFLDVAINPTILDGKGERMSKSKGNGVDPVEIIDAYGADALRFTLTLMATETQDVRMPVKKDSQGRNTSEKFEIGRSFANKLWNAARLIFANLEKFPQMTVDEAQRPGFGRWIVWRFNETVKQADAALATYRFDQYAQACYDFFWRDFCDWYLEAFKSLVKNGESASGMINESGNVLAAVFDGTLRLLHPIIPFVTEEIWRHFDDARAVRGLPGQIECPKSKLLVLARWPVAKSLAEPDTGVPLLQEIVGAIRNVRNEYKVDPKKVLDITARVPLDQQSFWYGNIEVIQQFASCALKLRLDPPENAARVSVAGCDLFVAGLANQETERERKEKSREELNRKKATLTARMESPGYRDKAPPKLVEQTKAQLAEVEAELAKLG